MFLNNVTGTQEDTVDFRTKMYKQLYQDIYVQGKQQDLLRLLEQSDKLSDGRVNPPELEKIIKQVTGGHRSPHSSDSIKKFVR